MKHYAYAAALVGLVALLVATFLFGRSTGADKVQAAWDQDRRERDAQTIDLMDRALQKSRELIAEAEAKRREDMEAALKASEERQAMRMESAVRRGAVEAATRAPGSAYTDPRCTVDEDTLHRLQEALR